MYKQVIANRSGICMMQSLSIFIVESQMAKRRLGDPGKDRLVFD
jgi:hypothetical protein